jgi:hypothetical protein
LALSSNSETSAAEAVSAPIENPNAKTNPAQTTFRITDPPREIKNLPIALKQTHGIMIFFLPQRTTAAPFFTMPDNGPSDAGEQSFEKEEYPPETKNVRRETSKDDLRKGPRDIGGVFIGPFCRRYHHPFCLIHARINRQIDHRDANYLKICAITPAKKQRKNPKTPRLNSILIVP